MTATPDINVAVCFDAKLALPFAVFAHSLRKAMKDVQRKVVLHVVHLDSLPQEVLRTARHDTPRFETRFVAYARDMPGFAVKRHVSRATFIKLNLPELLPALDKVLYIDVDALVFRSIEALHDLDLEGHCLAACPDYSLTLYAHKIGFQLHIKEGVVREGGLDIMTYLRDFIGLPAGRETDYFNTGVLLIDLNRWRKDRIGQRVAEFSLEHPHSVFHDQDGFNAVFKGDYCKFDHRWNAAACLCDFNYLRGEGVDDLVIAGDWLRDPWILHFLGRSKPWNPVTYVTCVDHLFWKVAAETEVLALLEGGADPDALALGLALYREEGAASDRPSVADRVKRLIGAGRH